MKSKCRSSFFLFRPRFFPFCTYDFHLGTNPYACPLTPFPFVNASFSLAFSASTSLLLLTASASISSTDSVSSHPIHASVMETPYLRQALPSAGTFWLPSTRHRQYCSLEQGSGFCS